MDHKSATVEVTSPSATMKVGCEGDGIIGQKDMSMPVCFLVKEQAKSLVAIQELQNRMQSVELIQDDVIESLVEIRNFLCGEGRSVSSLIPGTPSYLTKSPGVLSLKSSPLTKTRRFSFTPSVIKSTLEASHCGTRSKSASPRDPDAVSSELRKPLPCITVQEHSQKVFDLAKNKDSVLESDKQDSGLDSDCRETIDVHPSLGRHWAKQESNDELLQLLDEISERSEILQKQLTAVEENVGPEENQEVPIMQKEQLEEADALKCKLSYLEAANNTLESEKKDLQQKLLSSANVTEKRTAPVAAEKRPFDASVCFEKKSLSDRVSKIRKRATNRIDSAMVSSVLKETNVVDLQRQVLIYLVENAVLQTKLSEVEQSLQAKTLQSEKIENSLKDESRLLMMENRELRIGLDEQKFEVNSLRSKVAMLERVLQSVTVENRELNWQLGESLGLQNLSRKELHTLSSSFTFGNAGSSSSKHVRRSSLPHQFSNTSERSVKSKIIPNSNVFLDVTLEEPDQNWPQSAFRYKPGFASTPMQPYSKPKDTKKSLLSAPSVTLSESSPTNFQTVKKHLKCNSDKEGFSNQNAKCLEGNLAETLRCHSELADENGAAKFPFNTIIEKLKANSDYRIAKRVPLSEADVPGGISGETSKPATYIKTKGVAQCRDTESTKIHSQTVESRRKGKNIHQRIQDILDRIMAESEEAT